MGAPDWIARFQSLLASSTHLYTALLHKAQQLPGFQLDETMAGTMTFVAGRSDFPSGDRRVVLRLRVQADHLGDYLREGRTDLSGTAFIDGMVDAAPVSGSLWIWPHRRILRYELSFPVGADEQQHLRLSGQKDVRLLDFRYTMATLPSKLLDDQGKEVGHGNISFDWADLPSFLHSIRPVSASFEKDHA